MFSSSPSFAKQLSDIDAKIAASHQAAASLASKRKAIQSTIDAHLAGTASGGDDRPGLKAREQLRQVDDLLSFEEARTVSLTERRIEIAAEETAATLAAQWAAAAVIAERRLAAAKAASDAIIALSKSITELEASTQQFNVALPVQSNVATLDDIRTGITYSMIAAGIRWPFADAFSARTMAMAFSTASSAVTTVS
ncbi:hypothetical protein NKI51_11665 [Mesorhizobium australicum]|uniref:hypothetical protein n=1 Tax=Mesorhizobium australicum TaxID=536018 RepID=UPI0033379AFF